MISSSTLRSCPTPNPHSHNWTRVISSSSITHLGFHSKRFGKGFAHDSFYKPLSFCALKNGKSLSSTSPNSFEFDVVIIGAGIIGLTIARQFLTGSDLTVAVVDKAVPCSGATGAGQGYIWMTHKSPGSDLWELTMRSHELWESLAEALSDQGLNPLEELGWKKTGSLLIGRTSEELDALKRKVKQLSEAGLEADYLSGVDLLSKEPALLVGNTCGAAFLPNDCQLDAHRTVAFIEKANRHFIPQGRYAEFYYNPVTGLLRSGSNVKVEAVQTFKNTLYCKKAIILAAGCWSGTLLRDLLREEKTALDVPIMPRKGHLLVIENFNSLHLNHGLMEAGYVNHQAFTSAEDFEQTSISMTATMDVQGNLVLGNLMDNNQSKASQHGFFCLSPHICFLCYRDCESASHLFMHCEFTSKLWYKLLCQFDLSWVPPKNASDILIWDFFKGSKLKLSFWRCAVVALLWSVWLERNSRIFNNVANPWWHTWDSIVFRTFCWAKVVNPSSFCLPVHSMYYKWNSFL